MRRDDPSPPPWTPEGKKRIEKLGLRLQHPDDSNHRVKPLNKLNKIRKVRSRNSHEKKEKLPKKKQKFEPYHLDTNVHELIEKDSANFKLWQKCKSYLPDGKISFLNQVSKL